MCRPLIGGFGLLRWHCVEAVERRATHLILAAHGMAPAFGSEQLHGEPVGRLVRRILFENALDECLGLIVPSCRGGFAGRLHGDDLPSASDPLSQWDEPVFVRVAGQERPGPELQRDFDRSFEDTILAIVVQIAPPWPTPK